MQTLTITRRAIGVAQVTMARPAVFNAFDEAMIEELDAAFARLADDAEVRVVVLAGEGKHFSAGADLKWMERASGASREWNLTYEQLQRGVDPIPRTDKDLIFKSGR